MGAIQYTLDGDAVEVAEMPLPLQAEIYANNWEGEKILTSVLTISEVCELFDRTPKTVRTLCNLGLLEFRVTKRVWLISTRSAVKYYANHPKGKK